MSVLLSNPIKAQVQVSEDGMVPIYDVTLRYDTDDPYAVTMVFPDPTEGDKTWIVARDIIADAIHKPGIVSGMGDVITAYDGKSLFLLLRGDEGQAGVALDPVGVSRFLTKIYTEVPSGIEEDIIDIEGLIERIMSND